MDDSHHGHIGRNILVVQTDVILFCNEIYLFLFGNEAWLIIEDFKQAKLIPSENNEYIVSEEFNREYGIFVLENWLENELDFPSVHASETAFLNNNFIAVGQ